MGSPADSKTPMPGAFVRVSDVPQLATSLLLFMDLLGTSAAASGPNAQKTLEALDAALARARARSSLDEDWSWSDSAWFSDNLVVAANLETAGYLPEAVVGGVFVSAAWLQFLLAIEGFFDRGGVVVGDHFMDDKITFGPALVEAVALEKAAVQPRILLEDASVGLVHAVSASWGPNSTSNPFQQELAVDTDGSVFVNYLRIVFGEADDDAEAATMLELHRRAVQRKLRQKLPPAVRDKYRWSAGYHNWVCDELDTPDLKIAKRATPTMTSFVAEPPGEEPCEEANP